MISPLHNFSSPSCPPGPRGSSSLRAPWSCSWCSRWGFRWWSCSTTSGVGEPEVDLTGDICRWAPSSAKEIELWWPSCWGWDIWGPVILVLSLTWDFLTNIFNGRDLLFNNLRLGLQNFTFWLTGKRREVAIFDLEIRTWLWVLLFKILISDCPLLLLG